MLGSAIGLLLQLPRLHGLRRRAWVVSFVLVLVIVAMNYSGVRSPWVSLSSFAVLVMLVVCRRRFSMIVNLGITHGQFLALASVGLALAYGTVGSYLLRSQFAGIRTWIDAFYFTFVTYSTLGYGDVTAQTQGAKLFAVSMIAVGLTTFVTALTVVGGPLLERRIRGVMLIMAKFYDLTEHVVVCGYGSITEGIICEFVRFQIPYIIIDERKDVALALEQKGHNVINGDPTRRNTLEQANPADCIAIVAASDSDTVNVMIALAAADFKREQHVCRFRILVRIEDAEHIRKLEAIGVDEVLSPGIIVGKLIAERVLHMGKSCKDR